VNWLAAGVDDFINGSKSHRIVLARTELAIRKFASSQFHCRELTNGGLHINIDDRTASVNGKLMALTRTEFELLTVLTENAHRVVHRKELLDRVWGNWYGDDHILEVHISRLRRKVHNAGGAQLAVAVRGIGYRLTAVGQTVG